MELVSPPAGGRPQFTKTIAILSDSKISLPIFLAQDQWRRRLKHLKVSVIFFFDHMSYFSFSSLFFLSPATFVETQQSNIRLVLSSLFFFSTDITYEDKDINYLKKTWPALSIWISFKKNQNGLTILSNLCKIQAKF